MEEFTQKETEIGEYKIKFIAEIMVGSLYSFKIFHDYAA